MLFLFFLLTASTNGVCSLSSFLSEAELKQNKNTLKKNVFICLYRCAMQGASVPRLTTEGSG